jgi:hypothetical protein
MNSKNQHWLFIASFLFALVFYRLVVFLREGKVSTLRGLTGLNIHHSHYGIFLLTIAVILLVLKIYSTPATILAGFGLGSVLDSFISSMFKSFTRAEEIIHYNQNLLPTLVLFIGVIGITLLVVKQKTRFNQ